MNNKPLLKAGVSLNGRSRPISILKGILVSYIVLIPLFALFALILTNMDFPEKYIPTAVLVTTSISIIVAGSAATREVKSHGWLNGCIMGIVYILILYVLSSIVHRDFSISRYMLSLLGLGALSGAIGGIIGINLKKGSKTKSKVKK